MADAAVPRPPRRTRKVRFVRMRPGRLTAILSVVLVVAGCQSSPPPLPSSSSAPSSSSTPTKAPPALPPTSETLIAAALTSGKITYEQSLLYRALALFDSPGLPSKYRSSIPDMEAASPLLGEIDAKESTLSADLLKKLEPYRARPADPVSIFNTAPAPAAVNGMMAAAGPLLGAGTTVAWRSQTAAGGKARVWIREGATAAEDAARHVADVSKVWAAYPGVFTYPNPDMPGIPNLTANPDSAIDVYFFDAGAIDPRDQECAKHPTTPFCTISPKYNGFAPHAARYVDNKSSGYLVIDAALTGDKAIDTIAHELAHAAQFAYDNQESSWLMESTATWVAFKVCKKLGIRPNYQYSWLPLLYGSLDQTLTRTANDNAYASWLYFLYASMEQGDGVVTDIWKAAGAEGEQGAKAVDQVFPFATYFAGFSVRDWNDDPVKPLYKKADDTFPGNQPQIRNATKTLAGGQEDKMKVDLPPLASAYYQYDFAADVRDVTFENALDGYDDARVWAFKKIDGEWKAPEDWTALPKKKFCRDIPEANVTQLVVVVANKSMTGDLTADPPKMIAGTAGCSGWSGTMTGSAGWTNEGYTGTSKATFTGVWMIDEKGDAYCRPESEAQCLFFRPEGTIAWTYESHHPVKNFPCDSVKSGSEAANQERHDDQQNFYLLQTDKDHLQFWGRGYFEWPAVGCTPPMPSDALPVFFDIYQDSSSSIPPAHGNTCERTDWIISSTADTISGSCYLQNVPQGWSKLEWHLTRIGPKPGS